MGEASVLRLHAAAAESMSGVTLGGSSVNAEGLWSGTTKERIRDGMLRVPAMSAVVARAAGA
jgi:hypothetical protein